ncbi:probable disease resistance protein RF9 [Eucalyptus grandis]|uniref:probable disease resistance protein RF9 n=1 Tax=Eucalyptus grandis TaxID=71139 RepID=UPI00192F0A41|nr:probable disease resistance protein RF9 [Eucalyptus grandis]
MAASELAVSLAIVRLHDLLSKSKDNITYQNLTDKISSSISDLQSIQNTRKHTVLEDGHNQKAQEGKKRPEVCPHKVEKIGEVLVDLLRDIDEAILVDLPRDQMSESQGACFAKVFALVRLLPVMSGAHARKKMAKTKVESLRGKVASLGRLANDGMPDHKRASSSSLSKRNRENTRQRVESDIVGRDGDVRTLLAWLIDDHDSSLRVMSVVGEKACGKTALVRSVFSKRETKHHFHCRAWVRVPDLGAESDRMKNLLVDILKQTPLRDQAKDMEHKQEEQLFEMLNKLLMGLRYLIVLDNLCEGRLVHELLVPFMDWMNGSRVIVTTTNAEMQKFADPWTPYLRLPLDMTDFEECKKLLWVSITGDDSSKSEMTNLEQRILSKNRSPPAISLLGGLLFAVEESNWAALIDRLGERPNLDDVMCLSFDELPYLMKPCVLYMAFFPKESEVPTRRLFRLWAAEGLSAQDADGSAQMRSAKDCFCELESRNFIHVVRRKPDGSAGSCRMPAFLHEFVHRKAEEFGLLRIQDNSDSDSEKESKGKDPVAKQSAQSQQKQVENTATGHYGYKVPCLQSFASFDTRKLGTQARIESPILGRCLDLLRVVDFEGVYKPVLPENFGNMLCILRYLGLRWTVLYSIPESVGNLLLLETLDLKHTNITKVTSAIWNAKYLRHLYLSEASFDESIRRHISSGKSLNTKLETVWGLLINTEKSPMISVLEKLQSLKKLGMTCRPEAVEAVTKCISNLTGLKSLGLRSRDLFGQPADLNLRDMLWLKSLSNLYLLGSLQPKQDLKLSSLFPHLKALTLSMSELEHGPMEDLGRLTDLTLLRLLARSCACTSWHCEKNSFPKLRILKLWMLEKWENWEVKNGAMDHLQELEIRHCTNLKKVEGLNNINSLKSVSLTGVTEDLAETIEVPKDTLVKKKELMSKVQFKIMPFSRK